jgi:glycosyltransferase involved in cell wall biosynthesis
MFTALGSLKLNCLNDGGYEGFVNAKFLTQNLTGVQRYAVEMTEALDSLVDRGVIDNNALSLRLVGPKGVQSHGLDLKHIPVTPVGRLQGELWSQLELPYHARGRLLWSPGNTGPIYHDKHVVTIHDVSVLDHPEWFSRRFSAWYSFLLPRLARNAAQILTVSEFSRTRLSQTLSLDTNCISVVPRPISSRFRPMKTTIIDKVLTRLALPRIYVLSLGSLEPRKNIARLLEAWSLLLARKALAEDVHMVVVGGKSSLYRNVNLTSVPDRVLFTGYVADEHLPALYTGALAFVYPSIYEGFGSPPLEAMACGAPVVTSSSTSIPEVVGRAAVLVDPLEVESIADGIRSIIENSSLRETMRIAGLQRAKLFNWDNSARLVWETLNKVASS